MPPTGADDDVKAGLARIEGMLQATLPQHAARLEEHDRQLGHLDARQRVTEQHVAVLQAASAPLVDVAALRAADQRGREDARSRSSTLWQAVAAIATIALVAVTLWAIFR